MSRQVDLRSRFLGGMVGSALGDAIGELAFSLGGEAALRARISRAVPLEYTDDTAMAIGLAESLVQLGRLDPRHVGDTFRANYDREPYRGYAIGPPTVFSLVERGGMSYLEAARTLFGGQGSFGNGAAMRVAPVGLFFRGEPDLYERVRASAVVTHAHPVGIDGAAVLARAIAGAVELAPGEPFPPEAFGQALIEFARTGEMRTKMKLVGALLAEGIRPGRAAMRLGQGVAAHESVPFAIYSFLCNPRSFERCLCCAVLNGGDRDTLGAMACAISGAYLGIEAIPKAWREKLEKREYIEDLAIKLAQMSRGAA